MDRRPEMLLWNSGKGENVPLELMLGPMDRGSAVGFDAWTQVWITAQPVSSTQKGSLRTGWLSFKLGPSERATDQQRPERCAQLTGPNADRTDEDRTVCSADRQDELSKVAHIFGNVWSGCLLRRRCLNPSVCCVRSCPCLLCLPGRTRSLTGRRFVEQ